MCRIESNEAGAIPDRPEIRSLKKYCAHFLSCLYSRVVTKRHCMHHVDRNCACLCGRSQHRRFHRGIGESSTPHGETNGSKERTQGGKEGRRQEGRREEVGPQGRRKEGRQEGS